MIETKDNKLGIFMAISKHWPKEQREKYLKMIREENSDIVIPMSEDNSPI